MISVIVGLVTLLFILLLLLAVAGIGIGWGMRSPSRGTGQSGEPDAASTNEKPGTKDDTSEAPSPETDSSSETPPAAGNSPPPKPETPGNESELGPEKKDEEPEKESADEPKSTDDVPESSDSAPQDTGVKKDNSGSSNGHAGSGDADSEESDGENVFSIAGGNFFGLKAEKGSIVYVVDCSGSMMGVPYDRARNEILRSVKALKRDQAYFVILFSDSSFPMYYPDEHPKMVLATPDNFKKLQAWLNSFSQPGGTEPSDALLTALEMRPKTIFFLTDGGFDSRVVDEIRNANIKKIRINTIAFVTRGGEALLKTIANQNSGKYLFVP